MFAFIAVPLSCLSLNLRFCFPVIFLVSMYVVENIIYLLLKKLVLFFFIIAMICLASSRQKGND